MFYQEAKENLLVNILDVAEPAVEKAKPRRRLILIMSVILGIMLGMTGVLVNQLWIKSLQKK